MTFKQYMTVLQVMKEEHATEMRAVDLARAKLHEIDHQVFDTEEEERAAARERLMYAAEHRSHKNRRNELAEIIDAIENMEV